jgi:two-component system, OmpR family, sensor histidine kinase SenX3
MRTLSIVDATAAATLGGMVGMLIGAGAVGGVRLSERSQRTIPQTPVPALPPGVADVLSVLRSSGIVVDSADQVVKASPAAVVYGLVRDAELAHAELRHLARQVRRDGVIREAELDLARGPLGRGRITVAARVAPLGSAHVLLLVDDRTKARRVEEVRRDFVANVSHELKTPVGGIALLAEAVLDANDDPEAVARFAQRMKVESVRLTKLVQEIVDLSRLQVADTLHDPVLVDVSRAASDAVEQSRLVAEAREIELAVSLTGDAKVFGDAELLTTAIRNLVGNAVNYSGSGTRVAVGVRCADDLVEVDVSDQGQGIPHAEQARIFERFYRVDAARSRATGGTGLGLAIVKHICANHGGDVTVWSEEGRGSTFTMRLPAAPTSGPPSTTPAAVTAGSRPPFGHPDSREVTR